jgi:hypothetical protein
MSLHIEDGFTARLLSAPSSSSSYSSSSSTPTSPVPSSSSSSQVASSSSAAAASKSPSTPHKQPINPIRSTYDYHAHCLHRERRLRKLRPFRFHPIVPSSPEIDSPAPHIAPPPGTPHEEATHHNRTRSQSIGS